MDKRGIDEIYAAKDKQEKLSISLSFKSKDEREVESLSVLSNHLKWLTNEVCKLERQGIVLGNSAEQLIKLKTLKECVANIESLLGEQYG